MKKAIQTGHRYNKRHFWFVAKVLNIVGSGAHEDNRIGR